jgi:chromosomal replication initiator protein
MDQDGSRHAAIHTISRDLAQRIGRHSYDMWFGHAARLQVLGTRVEVATESRFVADWIGGHFRDALDGAARTALGEAARVDLRVAPDLFDHGNGAALTSATSGGAERSAPANGGAATAARPARVPGRRRRRTSGLRRLEDFVVGSSNRLAYSAAERLARAESGEGSCLFLHGECGVGKTHLLQGVARHCTARSSTCGPQAVRYITAEQFTNEYINAVRGNTIARFRQRTRRLELLAIDDVHFLANKAATQNEFLHTIDAIAMAGGRLALASDEHPRQLGFNQALSSRLVAGMVARIDRPDRDTRLTIVHRLAAGRGFSLSSAAADGIAGRCSGSVRELEGAVTKLAALRLVGGPANGAEVGMVMVERLFADGSWRPKAPLRVSTIIDVVGDRLGVSRAELLGSGRHRRVVTARGLVAYLARDLTTLSFPEIAHALGRKHHSTVHTAAARIAGLLRQGHCVELGANGDTTRLDDLVDQLRHEIVRAAKT